MAEAILIPAMFEADSLIFANAISSRSLVEILGREMLFLSDEFDRAELLCSDSCLRPGRWRGCFFSGKEGGESSWILTETGFYFWDDLCIGIESEESES